MSTIKSNDVGIMPYISRYFSGARWSGLFYREAPLVQVDQQAGYVFELSMPGAWVDSYNSAVSDDPYSIVDFVSMLHSVGASGVLIASFWALCVLMSLLFCTVPLIQYAICAYLLWAIFAGGVFIVSKPLVAFLAFCFMGPIVAMACRYVIRGVVLKFSANPLLNIGLQKVVSGIPHPINDEFWPQQVNKPLDYQHWVTIATNMELIEVWVNYWLRPQPFALLAPFISSLGIIVYFLVCQVVGFGPVLGTFVKRSALISLVLFLTIVNLPTTTILGFIEGIVSFFLVPFQVFLDFDSFSHVRFTRKLGHVSNLFFLTVTIRIFRLLVSFGLIEARNASYRSKRTWKSVWNRTMMDLGAVVDSIALPRFIRGIPLALNTDGVNRSNEIMASLGWPEAVRAFEGPGPEATNLPFTEWAAFHFFPSFGIRQAKFYFDYELKDLAAMAPTYFRTEEYKSLVNEIESTSRYFNEVDYSFPDIDADYIWPIIGKIFHNSQLVPFRHIIRKWEKKYALGAMWILDGKKPRKLPRKTFIHNIGGVRAFEALWERTFMVAHDLVSINTVSVKGEALKPSKFIADKVRTVIGSPLPSYITATIWNYWSNHNFKYWDTPVKVGMPLNGANLSHLWEKHSRFPRVWAGDMTAFDSTLSGRVLEVIKQVRKKGFENHSDFDGISYLIDRNYELVEKSFLAHNSTGTAYRKGTGLSTGHSSTSMDNSLATVILYMMAWKQLTGLSAQEFKFFNELSVYGDDHFNSTLANAPAAWNFDNIAKIMATWGVTMRREDPDKGLNHISFLSKRGIRPLPKHVAELQNAGVPVPSIIVFHERDKLLGKIPAKVRVLDRDYRIKRLLSYLTLTAHHPDIYEEIVKAINRIALGSNKKFKIPSYSEVLRMWYDPKTSLPDFSVFDTESEEEVMFDSQSERMYSYGMVRFYDRIANFLSNVPDVMNPSIYNQGYIRFFNSLLGAWLSWPLELLAAQNNAFTRPMLLSTLQRTPYAFLIDAEQAIASTVRANGTTLLVRHWIFLLLRTSPVDTRWSLPFIDAFFRKLSVFAFVATGEVQEELRGFNFQFTNSLIIAALNVVSLPEIPFITNFRIPNFSLTFSRLSQIAFNRFWASVPPSFNEVNKSLPTDVSAGKAPLLIQAPTGSGKSTTLFVNITLEIGANFNHVILVEPRAILVGPLSKYLNDSFNVGVRPISHDHPFEPSESGNYVCTATQVFLQGFLDPNNLIIVDECHIDESIYKFLLSSILNFKVPCIMLTATPTPYNLSICSKRVSIPMARVYGVTHLPPISLGVLPSYKAFKIHYAKLVTNFVHSTPPSASVLIFVLDIAHAESIASQIRRRVCVLTSKSMTIDYLASIYVCTSVADAGITIPNVDFVLSTNIIRQVVPKPGTSVNQIVHMNESTSIQRAGRTGRTNNGFYQLYTVPQEAPFIDPYYELSVADDTFSVVGSGVPGVWLGRVWPEGLINLVYPHFKGHYDRSQDEILDILGNNIDEVRRAMGESVDLHYTTPQGHLITSLATSLMGDWVPSAFRTGADSLGAALTVAGMASVHNVPLNRRMAIAITSRFFGKNTLTGLELSAKYGKLTEETFNNMADIIEGQQSAPVVTLEEANVSTLPPPRHLIDPQMWEEWRSKITTPAGGTFSIFATGPLAPPVSDGSVANDYDSDDDMMMDMDSD